MINKNVLKLLITGIIFCSLSHSVMAESTYSGSSPSYFNDKWTYYSDVYGYNQNGRWGLADQYGVRCSARYETIEAFDNDFIKVSTGYRTYGLIDKYCNTIIPVQYDSIEKNNFNNIIARKNDLYTVYNNRGQMILPYAYYDLEQLTYDYFRYKIDYYYGIVNTKGQAVLPAMYENIFYLTDDLFGVQKGGLYGIVSAEGIEICAPSYDSIKNYSSYMFDVEENGAHGLLTKNGTLLISPQFDSITMISDVYFNAKGFGTYVYDITGKQLFANKYKSVKYFDTTFFEVETYDKKHGVVDKTGTSVTNGAVYSKVEKAKDNYIKVKKDGKWGAYNLLGKEVLPCIYGPLKINSMVKNLSADTEHAQKYKAELQTLKVLMAYLYFHSGNYVNARNNLNEYYKTRATDTETANIAQTLKNQLYSMGIVVN